MQTNPLPMWVYDLELLTFLEVNDAAVKRYGYSRDRFVSMKITDIRPEHEVGRLLEQIDAGRGAFDRSGPWQHRTASGQLIEVEVTSHLVSWEGRPAVLVAIHELSRRTDGPGGEDELLERFVGPASLLDHLRDALTRTGGRPLVVTVGLDRLERVTPLAGVTAMYALMEKVSQRLARACATDDLLARVGSTTFVVLRRDAEATDVSDLPDAILRNLEETVELPGLGEVALRAAIGVRRAEEDERDPEIVLRDALSAMDEAVARQDGVVVTFDPGLAHQARVRFELEQSVRQGLRCGEFRLHYQPVVDVASEVVVGFEALLRWQRPGHGLVGPIEVIDVAEQSGLIVPLGYWVIEQGLADLASLRSAHPGAFVAINLSPYQLSNRSMPDRVVAACCAAGVEPSSVCLELTETSVVSAKSNPASYEALVALRGAGFKIAIDDFGTGYSSLSYLKQLPVDIVKIDRSF
ncbi:MAG TPA: EAL domain-containing protein, partial [Acidimicrobiales bacterium]|nr:EAL domain-containing protein [Acidimicrobiales bacterium]